MKREQNNLEELKGKNPFKVPEGYMEGLTDRIMSQLPEKPQQEAKRISLMERSRPWLYMAAMFVGLGLFFRVIVGFTGSEGEGGQDSLLVQNQFNSTLVDYDYDDEEYSEDEEFLDYLETKYANDLLVEEMTFSE